MGDPRHVTTACPAAKDWSFRDSQRAQCALDYAPMLTNEQRKALRARGQKLKPVILMGQHGLTEAVMAEIQIALDHHELLKIRLPAADSAEKAAMLDRILAETKAEPIQRIGHVALIYKENPDKKRVVSKPGTVSNRAKPRK